MKHRHDSICVNPCDPRAAKLTQKDAYVFPSFCRPSFCPHLPASFPEQGFEQEKTERTEIFVSRQKMADKNRDTRHIFLSPIFLSHSTPRNLMLRPTVLLSATPPVSLDQQNDYRQNDEKEQNEKPEQSNAKRRREPQPKANGGWAPTDRLVPTGSKCVHPVHAHLLPVG
jgi:hypothetical protein